MAGGSMKMDFRSDFGQAVRAPKNKQRTRFQPPNSMICKSVRNPELRIALLVGTVWILFLLCSENRLCFIIISCIMTVRATLNNLFLVM